MKTIQLHEPYFFSDELKSLNSCVKSGWVSTGGQYVKQLENQISKFTKSKYSIALNSRFAFDCLVTVWCILLLDYKFTLRTWDVLWNEK